MSKRNAPVVIMRKDKRIRHKFLHAAAFAVTGGVSGIVTATEAANHAGYNARTRELQHRAEEPEPAALPPLAPGERGKANSDRSQRAAWRREHVPSSKEYRAAHGS